MFVIYLEERLHVIQRSKQYFHITGNTEVNNLKGSLISYNLSFNYSKYTDFKEGLEQKMFKNKFLNNGTRYVAFSQTAWFPWFPSTTNQATITYIVHQGTANK